MSHRTAAALLVVALVVVPAVVPEPASACGAPACQPARVAVEGGSLWVPANVPGIRVELGFDPSLEVPVPPTARLFEVDRHTGERVEHAVRLVDDLVIPELGLVPDARYELEVGSTCGGESVLDVVMVETGTEVPMPDAIGALTASPAQAGAVPAPDASGGCYDYIEATYVDVVVELDGSAAAWWEALVWETWVDGSPYAPIGTISPSNPYGIPDDHSTDPRGSWRGPGMDRVYAACDASAWSEGVAEGVHEVVMRATIPGAGVVLETAPVTIELGCHAPPPAYEDPYCPSGIYGPQGACHPGGEPLPPSTTSSSSGGGGSAGCSASGAPVGGSPWLALGLLAGALRARRRARRHASISDASPSTTEA